MTQKDFKKKWQQIEGKPVKMVYGKQVYRNVILISYNETLATVATALRGQLNVRAIKSIELLPVVTTEVTEESDGVRIEETIETVLYLEPLPPGSAIVETMRAKYHVDRKQITTDPLNGCPKCSGTGEAVQTNGAISWCGCMAMRGFDDARRMRILSAPPTNPKRNKVLRNNFGASM